MIKGVITTKDVFTNGFTIARCFGGLALLRCWAAIFSHKQTTFLACIYPPGYLH